MELEVCTVPASRLAYGTGDIHESYSGDRICEASGKVRKPFRYAGSYWVCVGTSSMGGHVDCAEAYRVLALASFEGKPTTYAAKVNRNPADADNEYAGDAARNDPLGFYHGMRVKYGRDELVLVGPQQRFAPAPEIEPETEPISQPTREALQLSMF